MLESRILPGYECRNESMFKIADALGLPYERTERNNKQLDKIYRDLAPVFQGEDTLPIGTGKTGRIRQTPTHKLYTFAKKQYNVEVEEWNPSQDDKPTKKKNKESSLIVLITSFLNRLDEGRMKPEEFIGAVRGIFACHLYKE